MLQICCADFCSDRKFLELELEKKRNDTSSGNWFLGNLMRLSSTDSLLAREVLAWGDKFAMILMNTQSFLVISDY